MTYVAYARRFRPQRFDELVGQDSVVLTLRHALEEGRASHAYLFAGPRGVGKTTTARILAKALNCERGAGPDPCGECSSCVEIAGGGSLDVIEIDAASHNSVDNIRELREAAHNATHGSRYRLYILDEVHMLSGSAFNALLKILEEPPPHVKFVLCTTDPQKVPETVRSRCQRLDFRRITAPQVVDRLRQIAEREKLSASDEALRAVALHVQGGMRDAEVLLEQLSVYADGEITAEHVRALTGSVDETKLAELCEALAEGDAGRALARADAILDSGTDTGELIDALLVHLRGALAVQACGESDAVVASRGIDVASAEKTASLLTQENLLYCAAALQSARKEAGLSEQPRIALELALVRLSRVKEMVSLEEIAARVSEGPPDAGLRSSSPRSTSRQTGGTLPGGAAAVRGGEGSGREAGPRPFPRAERAPSGPPSGTARRVPSRHAVDQEVSPFRDETPPVPAEDVSPSAGEDAPPPPAGAPAGPPRQSVAGELDLEEVLGLWDSVRSRVAQEASSVGALLKPAEVAGVAGNEILLAFPAKYTFHMNGLLADRGRLALVESTASEIIGRPVRVSLEPAGEAGRGRRGKPRPRPPEGRLAPEADIVNDPTVRKVMERFKGRVVRVNRGRPDATDARDRSPDEP